MPRPTPTQLTTASFSQVGTTTKYTKTTGTALATCDVGTGECSIKPVNPAAPLATADLQAHLATFASLGITEATAAGTFPRPRPAACRSTEYQPDRSPDRQQSPISIEGSTTWQRRTTSRQSRPTATLQAGRGSTPTP